MVLEDLERDNLSTVIGATGWACGVLKLWLLALIAGSNRGRSRFPLGTASSGPRT